MGRILALVCWLLLSPLATAAPVTDSRVIALRQFLKGRPLQRHAQEFVTAADMYKIDWKLVPAISIVESSGGKHMRSRNNAFGWNSGKARFRSMPAAIRYVTQRLAEGPRYRGKTNYSKLRTYNPVNKRYPLIVYTHVHQLEKLHTLMTSTLPLTTTKHRVAMTAQLVFDVFAPIDFNTNQILELAESTLEQQMDPAGGIKVDVLAGKVYPDILETGNLNTKALQLVHGIIETPEQNETYIRVELMVDGQDQNFVYVPSSTPESEVAAAATKKWIDQNGVAEQITLYHYSYDYLYTPQGEALEL